jgi:hypothetical protein
MHTLGEGTRQNPRKSVVNIDRQKDRQTDKRYDSVEIQGGTLVVYFG